MPPQTYMLMCSAWGSYWFAIHSNPTAHTCCVENVLGCTKTNRHENTAAVMSIQSYYSSFEEELPLIKGRRWLERKVLQDN